MGGVEKLLFFRAGAQNRCCSFSNDLVEADVGFFNTERCETHHNMDTLLGSVNILCLCLCMTCNSAVHIIFCVSVIAQGLTVQPQSYKKQQRVNAQRAVLDPDSCTDALHVVQSRL